MKRTLTVDVYSFDELSEEVQKEVINENRYINVEGGMDLDEDHPVFYVKKLDGNPFSWTNVWFNIEYRYKHIQFENLDISIEDFQKLFDVPEELRGEFKFENCSYRKYSSTYVDFPYVENDQEDRIQKEFEELMNTFLKCIEDEYNHLISNEQVIERLMYEDDLWFLEDGTEVKSSLVKGKASENKCLKFK